MSQIFKDHPQTFAIVASLALVLITLTILSLSKSTSDGPVLIGLGGAITTLCGALAGKQMSQPSSPSPPTDSTPPAPPVPPA
jgi:hypothetical protein